MAPHSSKSKHIIIAGGGTAGWLAAAAIGKVLGSLFNVTIIESQAIGRIGVGEATIPPLRTFHRLLGIDEAEFMSYCQATIKLGIEFSHWKAIGDSYIHSFGVNGQGCWACDFQHFWLAGKKKGLNNDAIGEYCRELIAAKTGKALGKKPSDINYAYHLDAQGYADFLKKHALKHQVKHVNSEITNVNIRPADGHIESLDLANGSQLAGDFYIDCTGFAARLIHGALNTRFIDYGDVLPCDSAVAVQSAIKGPPRSYTQAIAHPFGWQWRIPLRSRVGNGLVYCSRYVSDDQAIDTLLTNLEAPAIGEPRAFKYKTGRRERVWNKNCVAVGLAAGFLEPVESTSIHLAMSAILRLLKLFPLGDVQPAQIAEFNHQSTLEMDSIRNFLVLHYHATQRDDSAFWRYCKTMPIPEALSQRINLFKQTATVSLFEKELFQVDSWIQVMLGQGIEPQAYHPIVDAMETQELQRFLDGIKQKVRNEANQLLPHQAFLDSFCPKYSSS